MLALSNMARADNEPTRMVVGKQKEAPAVEEAAEAMVIEAAHSPLGPSAAERWMVCTASVKACEGYPDTASSFAAEGTAAHEVSEWMRETGKSAKEYVGTKLSIDGFEIEVTQDWVAPLDRFAEYVSNLEGDAFLEERVHYTAWVENGWGTADDIRIPDQGTCHVTDLKFGKGVQKWAKGNQQLMLYALGVWQDYNHLYDIKDFVVTIHQPRLDHVDSHKIKVKDLLTWARDEVRPRAIEAITGKGAVFKAGPHCQFCPKKTDCEERDKAMQEDYASDFDTPDDEMPNYRLAEILKKIPDIKKWIAHMEERGLSELAKGNPVGDFKMVAGRGSRVWDNKEEAEKALRAVRKLKVRDIFPPGPLISVARAEKLLGLKHPVMVEHAKKLPGKPTMVPGDDPRQSLQINAEDEFDNLDGDDAE
jgi:hypothetical protein